MNMLEFLKKLNPFKWLNEKIAESMNDHLGKSSATRINGYIMTLLLSLITFTLIGIELYSAYMGFSSVDHSYTPSTQILYLVTLILGQQALLFQLKRKGEETSFPTLETIESNKVLVKTDVTEDVSVDNEYEELSEYSEKISCENCSCEGECLAEKDLV